METKTIIQKNQWNKKLALWKDKQKWQILSQTNQNIEGDDSH
jgi:hypothetical protein